MDIAVRLFVRNPKDALVQRQSVDDDGMYHPTAAAAAATDREVITWDFKDISISYQQLTTDEKTTAAISRRSVYFADVPRVSIDHVASGKMFSHNTVTLPPGCKFILIAWVLSDNVFLKTSSNRPLSARYHFPPNAVNLKVSFEGEAGLLFGAGFEEIGTEKARNSMTSRSYFSSLCHGGQYSKDLDSMFPKHPSRSYNQFLLFDFSANKITANTPLHIHVKYADAGGVPGYCLASVLVQQMEYTYSHGQEIKAKLVI